MKIEKGLKMLHQEEKNKDKPTTIMVNVQPSGGVNYKLETLKNTLDETIHYLSEERKIYCCRSEPVISCPGLFTGKAQNYPVITFNGQPHYSQDTIHQLQSDTRCGNINPWYIPSKIGSCFAYSALILACGVGCPTAILACFGQTMSLSAMQFPLTLGIAVPFSCQVSFMVNDCCGQNKLQKWLDEYSVEMKSEESKQSSVILASAPQTLFAQTGLNKKIAFEEVKGMPEVQLADAKASLKV